ncbi:hypothetical protein HPP92_018192 [Vanilla planifolia]|uniref:Uncharacterized protein n=1 Tax=Vanilla planifolia TaxID=51239 RepID=A0A835UMM9_VANPL|nr:hypothetical protein HPP92_018192 [Vanilla planifolia]
MEGGHGCSLESLFPGFIAFGKGDPFAVIDCLEGQGNVVEDEKKGEEDLGFEEVVKEKVDELKVLISNPNPETEDAKRKKTDKKKKKNEANHIELVDLQAIQEVAASSNHQDCPNPVDSLEGQQDNVDVSRKVKKKDKDETSKEQGKNVDNGFHNFDLEKKAKANGVDRKGKARKDNGKSNIPSNELSSDDLDKNEGDRSLHDPQKELFGDQLANGKSKKHHTGPQAMKRNSNLVRTIQELDMVQKLKKFLAKFEEGTSGMRRRRRSVEHTGEDR